jgi:nicotinamidase-related amidase
MPTHLLDPTDCILIAIDIQDAFLDKLPAAESKLLLNRACWLVSVAHWLNIPLIVTAEELPSQPLAAQLMQALPANTPVYNKLSFGLAYQPDILDAVNQTPRSTAVLIGLETDVCVAQSALGLIDLGYQVAVVADATGSPDPGHQIGLNRMQAAGAIVVSTKSLFYEWMRTVDHISRFHAENPAMRNVAGITL